MDWIVDCVFTRWPTANQPLARWLDHHCVAAKSLSDGPSGAGGSLWEQTPGRDTKVAIDELALHAASAGDVGLLDYSAVLRGVLGAGETRDQNTAHPNILIWGTLEARVQSADLVILAGLNDGTWPEPVAPDPWLNRSLRLQAGLLLPERRIGLSAHDFQQAIGAKTVWVTRALRSDDAETVPSRWLNRIENLLNGLPKQVGGTWTKDMRSRGDHWVRLVEAVEATMEPSSTPRPSIAPPVHTRPTKLAVTDIKHLIRDPYAIYAKYVLNLRRLDPLTKTPDAPLRGTVIHDVLEVFVNMGPWMDAPQAKTALLNLSSEMLKDLVPWPAARRMWQARIARFADWFVAGEGKRQEGLLYSKTEVWGEVALPTLGFTLVWKADRVDVLHDGAAHIYDYKTGKPPSKDQQLHFDKQLLLEVEMLRRGGFKRLGARQVVGATYIGLGNDPEDTAAPLDETDVWAELSDLIRAYQDPEQGYSARRAMLLADASSVYDHLARYGEWSTNQSALLIKVSK